ncbi:nose resistant to fluoxetine protein 6-like, partial [Odontomachus brunneus]|uniref:nose resistant to fluoxetine protein 6-like n=1 Tax=Odontomachus brunneus TaxID=486640 RepID=UPI0013F229DC
MSNKDRNHTTTMGNIMLHFSARKNYAKILHMNYTHTGLDSIYFIRLVNMVFVVYLHNVVIRYIYNPTVNTVDIEKLYQIPFVTIIVNVISTMTIFFAIGGILHSTKLLKDLERYNQLKFFKNIVSRYLRLTPLYVISIGVCIWILPLCGSGPYWYLVVEQFAYCSKNWWKNLLYVNNYLTPSELCVPHGWYLAADFQLFVCSQFVIY